MENNGVAVACGRVSTEFKISSHFKSNTVGPIFLRPLSKKKNQVKEIMKERWSVARGSFTQKYWREWFHKSVDLKGWWSLIRVVSSG